MHKATQKKVLRELKEFMIDYFGGEDALTDTSFRTGDDAVNYSEYAHKENPWVSFEGPVYEYINYGYELDNFKFVNALTNYLDSKGLWYEQGHAWNFSIYEK
jgi:hypothetical protein